jgi:hypothetical protein
LQQSQQSHQLRLLQQQRPSQSALDVDPVVQLLGGALKSNPMALYAMMSLFGGVLHRSSPRYDNDDNNNNNSSTFGPECDMFSTDVATTITTRFGFSIKDYNNNDIIDHHLMIIIGRIIIGTNSPFVRISVF